MRQAVTAVLTFKDQIFVIQRQNYLSVFPGYHAFPGGKVDKEDEKGTFTLDNYPVALTTALKREIHEELGVDLEELIQNKKIDFIGEIGKAITPSFNPYRFETYFFKVELNEKIDFKVDEGEAFWADWIKASELLELYHKNDVLAVPPTIMIIEALGKDPSKRDTVDMTLPWDDDNEVPIIESLYGVKQLLPLSNTFPPANRTNSLIIGDVLIDPSPRKEDLLKYKNTIKKHKFREIFLTHRHPDHHEFSTEIAKENNVPMSMSQWTFDQIKKEFSPDYFDGVEVNIKKDGEVLTKHLGEDVLLYATPGHDEGQLSLAPQSLKWFFVSDLIQTIGTVVVGGPGSSMKKYFDSLKMVINKKPKYIIPSHGIAIGGTNKLENTLKHREQREAKIKELLSENKSREEILDVIYEGLDESLKIYALATIDSHIEKINSES